MTLIQTWIQRRTDG